MEKLLFGLAVLLLVGSLYNLNQEQSNEVPEDIQQRFNEYKNTYNKKYGSFEEQYRLQVYYDNIKFTDAFNTIKGEPTFGETMFFDLTDEEFAATYLTNLTFDDEELEVAEFPSSNNDKKDWRNEGAVNPIKDQGQCGSCWAFSTVSVVESLVEIQTKKLVDLSEQQLVDCSGILYGNLGCNGGMPSRALRYVSGKGLTTQAAYPYKAVQQKCQHQGGDYKVKGSKSVKANDAALKDALEHQPVSVAVDATNFKYYDPKTKAVFEDCGTQMNHAVVLEGYNNQENHYILRNSWNTVWGDKGYMKLKQGNTCGVLNVMVVPY